MRTGGSVFGGVVLLFRYIISNYLSWSILDNFSCVMSSNLLYVSPINTFLPILLPSYTTGVSLVRFQVWWSVRRRRSKVSIALRSNHLACSVTWRPTRTTRCSWLWPTIALRVNPATLWHLPPKKEVRMLSTHPKNNRFIQGEIILWSCAEFVRSSFK